MILTYRFNESVKIVNLGDIHRGNGNCNVKFLKHVIGEIEADPNCYWVSTGDLLEVATKHSVSDVHSARSTQEELDALSEELLPIRDKCLGFVASNHHNRVDKHTGLSLDRAVGFQVGIPYLGITGMINVVVGNGSHFICLHHGTGGGTIGNGLNRAYKASGIYKGCDVYMSGHTHKMNATPFLQQIIDRKRGIVRVIKGYVLITGHCLDWSESYAERMNLDPASLGFSYVDIKPNPSGREDTKNISQGFITP